MPVRRGVQSLAEAARVCDRWGSGEESVLLFGFGSVRGGVRWCEDRACARLRACAEVRHSYEACTSCLFPRVVRGPLCEGRRESVKLKCQEP